MGGPRAAGHRALDAPALDDPVPSLRASQVFMVLCAPALLLLALVVVFVVPTVLQPGAAPLVLGAAVLAQPVALLAVVRHRRTGRPQGWWSVWATCVIAVLTASVADQAFRQTAVTALVVGPLYAAMFCSARSMLVHLALALAVATGLVAVLPAEPLVRAARVVAVDMVLALAVAGLFVLRARLDAAVTRAVAARDRADALAARDPLTGLLNRRGLRAALAVRRPGPLGAVLLDIDHFKRINDSLGHGAGDDVLVRVARVLAATVREEDLLARIGGEEFLVLVPGLGASDVVGLAERLRTAVGDDGGVPPVTVSAGVAVGSPEAGGAAGDPLADDALPDDALPDDALPDDALPDDALPDDAVPDVVDALYARADRLLYRAKQEGRNRVCAETAPDTAPETAPETASRGVRPA